jgi:peptidyl-tRNA hydrolase, PTH1 family
MEREIMVLVGLGNPGSEYAKTRHNIGFMLLDRVAEAWNIKVGKRKFEGELGEGEYKGKRIILVKPRTFMNLSGMCVASVLTYYRLTPENMMVICDDFNLPLGTVRIRRNGSSGGQKGLASIISQAGTDNFSRMRIGIGLPPQNQEPVNYVLGKFTTDEQAAVTASLEKAEKALTLYLEEGIEKAMSHCNVKVREAPLEE